MTEPDFDTLVSVAVDRSKQARREQRREQRATGKRSQTVAARTRSLLEADEQATDVQLVRGVLAASGWQSSGFDAMTDDEVERVLRTARRVQTVALTVRRNGKGGAA